MGEETNHNICPGHNLLVFKVDQVLSRFVVIEGDVAAIRAMLADLQNNKIQLRTHDTALFGADMQGGVMSDVRQLKEDRTFRNKVWAAILGFIAANFGILWAWIVNRN